MSAICTMDTEERTCQSPCANAYARNCRRRFAWRDQRNTPKDGPIHESVRSAPKQHVPMTTKDKEQKDSGQRRFPPLAAAHGVHNHKLEACDETRRKGGERHLSTSAGIIFPSSASITCCQVFVEFGMTKPKSKSHSSMHCPCRKIRCSSRNLSISSTCDSTWWRV